MRHSRAFLGSAALALLVWSGGVRADEIKNSIAVFAGLDKITGRVVTFEAKIDETVQFGTLQITPRACYTKPPTEAPQTVSFMQADEVTVTSKVKRIFSGWIFAASPGLNGIEHPVYDVWLIDCKGGGKTIPDAEATSDEHPAPAVAAQPVQKPPPKRAAPGRGQAAAPAHAAPAASLPTDQAPPSASPPGVAPALGAPIEVGRAPGEQPEREDIAPPGPLPPELTPSDSPTIEDDSPPPPDGPD